METYAVGIVTRSVLEKPAYTSLAFKGARKDCQMLQEKKQETLFPIGSDAGKLPDVEVLSDKPIYIKLTPGTKDHDALMELLSVLKYNPTKVTPQTIVRLAVRQMHKNIFQMVLKRSNNNG